MLKKDTFWGPDTPRDNNDMIKETTKASKTTTTTCIISDTAAHIALYCGFCAQCRDCVQKHLLFYAYVERMEEQLLTEQQQQQQAVTTTTSFLPCEVAVHILHLLHIDIDWCNEGTALANIKHAYEEMARLRQLQKVMKKQQEELEDFRGNWKCRCEDDPTAIDRLSYFDQDHCVLLDAEVSHIDELCSVVQRQRYVAEEKRNKFFFISHRDKFAFRGLTGYVVQQASTLFTYLLYHSIQWRTKDSMEQRRWEEMGVSVPQPLSKVLLLVSRLPPKDVNQMQLYLQCKMATPGNMVCLQHIVGISGEEGTRPTYTCNDEYEWWRTGATIPNTELEIVHRMPSGGSDARNNACYIVRDRCWHDDNDLSQGQAFKTRKMLMQWLVDQGYAVDGTYCPFCLAWRRNNWDSDDAINRRFTYHCNTTTCPNYK